MDLLGIDVVIDSSTGKYGIIDVNAFPSKCSSSLCIISEFQNPLKDDWCSQGGLMVSLV